ncbi:catechol 2,3-dioxygenase-like lactoylglutathione lyase family enzyme [Erythromicrobium ramosum]|uniref:Bleomycin resistance protein n=1 Tax=Erythrobacter ramosus TaxID=35811 RepID=A0A6I4UNV3_9SPHN|nr:catechol 2,3-dioxygenase-like lactoylglutathione lyase family enzyme [Erythrobacter ramosus]MXP39133.1 bleomycin resistance protein [Erythrobacter ramosus]
MADTATPNLPARDFAATAAFYAKLGFEEDYRSDGWMILSRGDVTLEFFPYPDLDPYQSSFSCCLRLDDLGAIMRRVEASDVPDARVGVPRFHPAAPDPSGLTIAYLIDPDGTLLRLIQND